jgi:hypothetical protein
MIQIIIAVLMTIGVYATPSQINIISNQKSQGTDVVTFSDNGNNTTYVMSSTGGTEESGWGITSK